MPSILIQVILIFATPLILYFIFKEKIRQAGLLKWLGMNLLIYGLLVIIYIILKTWL